MMNIIPFISHCSAIFPTHFSVVGSQRRNDALAPSNPQGRPWSLPMKSRLTRVDTLAAAKRRILGEETEAVDGGCLLVDLTRWKTPGLKHGL